MKSAILRASTLAALGVCFWAGFVVTANFGGARGPAFDRLAGEDSVFALVPERPGRRPPTEPEIRAQAAAFTPEGGFTFANLELLRGFIEDDACGGDAQLNARLRAQGVPPQCPNEADDGGTRIAARAIPTRRADAGAIPNAVPPSSTAWAFSPRLRPEAGQAGLELLDLSGSANVSGSGRGDASSGGFDDFNLSSFTLRARLAGLEEDRYGAVSLSDAAAVAAAVEDTGMTRLQGQAAAPLTDGEWRLGPELEVGAVHLKLDEMRGGLGSALGPLDRSDEWFLTARPSLALRGEVDAGDGVVISPRLKAGATWLSQTEFSPTAVLFDAPIGVGYFSAGTPMSSDMFMDLEAGVDVAGSERFSFSLQFDRLMSRDYQSNAGRVQFNLRF